MTHRVRRAGACAAVALLIVAGGGRPARGGAPDEVTELSGVVEDVACAGGGRLLVVRLRGREGLEVYDAERREVVGTLPIGTADFAFGAGGTTAVVAPTDANAIQAWSLESFELVREKEFADQIQVTRIGMGRDRGDMAFVRLARGEHQGNQTTTQLLDAAGLSLLRPPASMRGQMHNASNDDYVHWRADGGLDRMAEWATSHSPSGLGMYVRAGDDFQYRYSHDSAGYLVPGDDGLLYTGYGIIYRLLPDPMQPFMNSFEPVGRAEGRSLLPGVGGAFVLGIDRDGQIDVYRSGQAEPLCRIDPFPDWSLPGLDPKNPRAITQDGPFPPGQAEEFIRGPLTLDKRVVFAPGSGYLLFLPPSNDRIVRREFDLQEAMEPTGADYLLVVSSPPTRAKAGGRWEYAMKTVARHGPVDYALESGPEGLTLDPEGRLAWQIPAHIRGEGDVVVMVTDAQGQEVRHRFTIAFD